MGYMHIDNLYKNHEEIMAFKRCYALEKIHGTSAHIQTYLEHGKFKIRFFSGGVSHERFVQLFDEDDLLEKFQNVEATVYGEAYGASYQKMSDIYGKELRFVAFDVKINDCWLSVPQAEEFVKGLGLEFVDYELIDTTLEEINRCRDKPSVQAMRNGMGNDKQSEGVVLRPFIEVTKNHGNRIIAKHKAENFRETKSPRQVSPEKLQVLADANAVAEEWVTPMRIQHVLDKIPDADMTKMKQIISAMQEDVKREGEGEIAWGEPVARAIGRATAAGVKQYFQSQIA